MYLELTGAKEQIKKPAKFVNIIDLNTSNVAQTINDSIINYIEIKSNKSIVASLHTIESELALQLLFVGDTKQPIILSSSNCNKYLPSDHWK